MTGLQVSDISREEVGEWLAPKASFNAQVCAFIPWKMKLWLHEQADRENTSMSLIVRRALIREMKANDKEEPK